MMQNVSVTTRIKPPSRHMPLDPNKLPHRAAEPVYRTPRTKPEEFKKENKPTAALSIIEESSELRVESLELKTKTSEELRVASLESKTVTDAGMPLLSTPNSQLSTEFFRATSDELRAPVLLAAVVPPNAEDLAETIEVQFTPEIRAKAQELGNNPVKIYEWVRNNVEFVPTYGSIQGAQMTLLTKQGNAFDIASLLIALLRVSNIPARYVYGTIELPIEKVMNWAGGFSDAKAALDLIASGGIPVAAYASEGKIAKVQMEHVWVEGYVPYGDYRGTIKDQSIKTWIPLDGAYKQYNYLQGLDFKAITGFDAQAFYQQLQSTATIDPVTGSVTNINSLAIQNQLNQLQTQIKDYINANIPNARVGDVFGGREIITQNLGLLPSTLPYNRIAVLSKYTEISDNLRHKISFSLLDEFGILSVFSVNKTLPELALKRITFSYAPATSADESLIISYANAEATSYPAYLINLQPELKINGVVVATGEVIGMGKNQKFLMTFTDPIQGTDIITNSITSGSFNAIGLDLGIIAPKALTDGKARLESVKGKLEAGDLAGITKEDILGEILNLTANDYFAQMDVYNLLNQLSGKVVNYRLPSEGTTASELKIGYMWEMPFYASFGGISIDIDRDMSIVKAKDGDQAKVKQFMVSLGMLGSAMEHSILEQLFSTPTEPAHAISAVKVISIANNLGIPIYNIDQNNISQIMPLLQVSMDVKNDIQNAVNAGKTVTIPGANISYEGWQGTGYIIMDPNTGAAVYRISGGKSGGWMAVIGFFIAAIIVPAGIVLIILGLAAAGPFVLAAVGAALVGIGIGIALSFFLSDKTKAELKLLTDQLLKGSLPFWVYLGLPWMFTLVVIAIIIITIFDILNRWFGNYLHRNRRIYITKYLNKKTMEA